MGVIGVDIGGTNVRIGWFENNQLTAKRAENTRSFATPAEAVAYIKHEIRALSQASETALTGIGVGAPGPLDPFRGLIISPPNLHGWRGVPLKSWLEDGFDVPVYVHNDANAAAVAEYVSMQSYAGRRAENIVYMTISTGVGTGVVCDGRLLLGHSGGAAEFGHTVIRPDGVECGCGQQGCIEAQISGTGIVKRMRAALEKDGEDAESSSLLKADGTSSDVLAAAKNGDALASQVVTDVQEDLSIAISNAVHAYNPQVFILGGGVMSAGDWFWQPAVEQARNRMMAGMKEDVTFRKTVYGEDLGLFGAAALVSFFER
ncbi:ROK family protein [Salisediminibacterium halotolerans]|uniref:Glucokinase n=1 Tax=Salisediminibacterium halotolerans TaxID=517425 RepID=A0A1H9VLX4_9BACI|nr:ROK family protein [Salisediminibacterium haloalkalitolerans]SES22203.1 glucokinase [Salisediminibacterium haloalkalitolerans]